MTGPEFEPLFFEAMDKWFKSGKVGPDPRGEWDSIDREHPEWLHPENPYMPSFKAQQYRWRPAKKRTVIIGGKELGWRETCYGPTNQTVRLIESGSSGIHQGIRWNEWPEKTWWIDGDSPSNPCLFKPLNPK
jgi:hypothetical protein